MAINVGDAVVKMGLDKTQFENGMKQVTNETERSAKRMQTGMRIVGAAITAVGIAGLKLVADARKMNAQLAQVAITAGTTTAEMRGLALELSNVTFRLKSVISTLAVLSRAGIRNEEDLKAHANAFDAFADAIGSTAEAVAEQLIPAYMMFGMELPRTAEDLDRLTWMVKNTMVSMQDLGPVFDYVAAYGQDLNVTFNDMISIMAILAERGITGSAVTKLFRTAITQAVTEGRALSEVLGITNAELTTYNQKIGEEAVGATQAYADVANEQFGIMDKLKSAWEDLTLSMGSALTPLEPIFALMTALGPLLLAMSITTLPALIANLKLSATALIGWAVAAGKAVAAAVTLAAAKIWAWAATIPVAGIVLGIAGVAALAASIIMIRKKAESAAAGLAEGGIVTRPTRALIGEAGPEAVIPLSKAGLLGTKEIHLHIGSYMGDEMSRRSLMRDLKEMMQEDDRLNFFNQIQSGYRYGTSGT